MFPKIVFYGIPTPNSDDESLSITSDSSFLTYACFDSEITDKTQILLFGFIVYELLMKKKPYKSINFRYIRDFLYGKIPQIDSVPSCYEDLIKDCWNSIPNDRPSFDKIVSMLKSDPKFILEGTDKDAYYEYIKLIDEYHMKIGDAKNKIISFEDFVDERSNKFKTYNFFDDNLIEDDEDVKEKNSLNVEYLNLNNYSKVKFVGEGLYGEVYQVESKDDKSEVYSAKISKNEIIKTEENRTNIYREALIISRLNHPSILKFIGYSPKDFEGENKPVILTEFSSNGSFGSTL